MVRTAVVRLTVALEIAVSHDEKVASQLSKRLYDYNMRK
jgi:hypothetical protein